MKIILPFRNKEKYPLTQRFGVKYLYRGKIAAHKGIDYGVPNFTPIIAPFDGIVTRITPERNYGYGHAVYLEGKDKKKGVHLALLAHLDHETVKVGYNMKRGQIVGYSGRSGFWRGVNGYHLHFGISVDGVFVDPLPLLKIKDVPDEHLFNQNDDTVKAFLGSYTIQKGDTLWGISRKYYNTGCHFMEIYLANQDILSSPKLIHPGIQIRIPALKNNGK